METDNYLADLHVHTAPHSSDAHSKPGDIAISAAEKGLDIVGVSNHNTVVGVWRFIKHVHRVNEKTGRNMLAVAGCEITTSTDNGRAHILVFQPEDSLLKGFLDRVRIITQGSQRPGLLPTIEEMVNDNDAIVIVPHPGSPIPSVSLKLLGELPEFLDEDVLKNVGVEVNNWENNVFPLNRVREFFVGRLTKKLGLAQFGGSDAHLSYQVGKQTTVVPIFGPVTGEGFKIAVRERSVYPAPGDPMSPLEQAGIIFQMLKDKRKMRPEK